MSRKAAAFVLGLALALIVGGVLWWWLQGRGGSGRGVGPGEEAAGPAERIPFELYFPADGGILRAERRDLEVTAAPKDRIRKVVQALLAGPKSPGTVRPFPDGVALGSVHLSGEGVAYLDLRWEGHEEPPPSGSTEEMQRLYSVINSVTLNVPQARKVVLLWNGLQRITFSGHLDTSEPLGPNRTMLAR